MNGRKPMIKLFIAAAVGVTALLAMTGTALAGTADYPSTGTFGVPDNTGQAGVPITGVRSARADVGAVAPADRGRAQLWRRRGRGLLNEIEKSHRQLR